MNTHARVRAVDHLDPSGIIVSSAERLAAVVNDLLADARVVELDFVEMPAVSSSFFNLVFRRVAEKHGIDAVDRVDLEASSPLLRTIFVRSREAARQFSQIDSYPLAH